MPQGVVFEADKLTKMTVSDKETKGEFVFGDRAGNELRLRLPIELGAAMVASVQALFISIVGRQLAGRPLRTHGEWAEIASRKPQTARASADALSANVILSLDQDSRYEVNYSLPLAEAQRLAAELLAAVQACRASGNDPLQ